MIQEMHILPSCHDQPLGIVLCLQMNIVVFVVVGFTFAKIVPAISPCTQSYMVQWLVHITTNIAVIINGKDAVLGSIMDTGQKVTIQLSSMITTGWK